MNLNLKFKLEPGKISQVEVWHNHYLTAHPHSGSMLVITDLSMTGWEDFNTESVNVVLLANTSQE